MYNFNKLFVIGICLISAMGILSCGGGNLGTEFTPVEAGYNLDPAKSIAIISGHNDDNDIQLTEMTIKKLSASGKFKVLSQSEIKKLIPRYPLNVNIIDFSISGDKDKRLTPYLSSTSKASIDALQKMVKTDYILIVWIDNLQYTSVTRYNVNNPSDRSTSTTKWMCIMSRLVEYPGGKIVGYSSKWNKDASILGISDWEDFFKDASSNLVKKIISKTNK